MEYVEMVLAFREERLAANRRSAAARKTYADPFDMPDKEFLNHFRLSKATVQQLYADIDPLMRDKKRGAVTKMNKLLTTLTILGGGSYQRGVSDSQFLSMSQPKVSQVVNEVVDILNDPIIYSKYIKFPQTEQERRAVVGGYHQKFGVPGVLGCIDCTHVAMIKPSFADHEERFFYKKGYYSRNVQIICDSDMRILSVDASYGGAAEDSFIWRMHYLHDHMEELSANGEPVWFFGDSGYPLRPWLITPIRNAEEGTPERHFSDRHVELHATVKSCIETLKARWRCMLVHRTLHYHHLTVGKIIYACCVLHNIAIGAADPVPYVKQQDIVVDRGLQKDADFVLSGKQVRRLYRKEDPQAGVARRQRIVEHLWARRQH